MVGSSGGGAPSRVAEPVRSPSTASRRLAGGCLLAGAAVVGSYGLIRSGSSEVLDRGVRQRLRPAHGPRFDRVVAVVTDLGSIYGMGGIATALLLAGRRSAGRDVAGAGAVAWVAAQAVKPLLRRPRPYEMGTARRLVAPPAGSSWPSGHAAVAAAIATVTGPRLTVGGRLVVTTGALLVGVSRLHVGVHHLTDVVAGLGVGSLSAALWRFLCDRVAATGD